jgi:hypothetical protein
MRTAPHSFLLRSSGTNNRTFAGNISPPEPREQLADPVVRGAHEAEMIGVGLIVILMVLKPF